MMRTPPTSHSPGRAAPEVGSSARSPLAVVLLALVRGYQQVVSPWLPPRCRFYPTCSGYAIDALRERGALVGFVLAGYRLLRCNPWARGGVDHVPHRGERWPSWDGVVDHRTETGSAVDPDRPGHLDRPGHPGHPDHTA